MPVVKQRHPVCCSDNVTNYANYVIWRHGHLQANSVTDFTFVSIFYELPRTSEVQCLRQMVKRNEFGRTCAQPISVVSYLTTFDPRKYVESRDASRSTPSFVKVIGSLKRLKWKFVSQEPSFIYVNEKNDDWFLDPKRYSYSSSSPSSKKKKKSTMKYNIIIATKTIRTQ